MKYIKFDKFGKNAQEAPSVFKSEGKTIIGYNSPANEEMLINDGYLKYDGDGIIANLIFKDGKILEEQIETTPIETEQTNKVYSKLKIRRALRTLGKEEILDKALRNRNSVFAKDWADSNEIDLDDDIFKAALKQFQITEETLTQVLEKLAIN